MRRTEKASARKWVGRARPLLEELLARDLRAASRQAPQLSTDAMLRDRQDQILHRIEEIRTQFLGSS